MTKAWVNLMLMALPASAILAQSARQISDAACAKACTIPIKRVLAIGYEDDTAVVARAMSIVQDARGNLIVAWSNGRSAGPPSVFDAKGHLTRTIGRRGKGPGEMTAIVALAIGAGDSVTVYEPTRVVEFSPQWKHVRTDSRTGFMLQGNVVRFGNGSFVGTGMEPVPKDTPRPVHFQSAGGDSKSLAHLPFAPGAGRLRILGEASGRASDGHFWIAQFERNEGHGYDLYLSDTTGKQLAALRRRPEWWHSDVTATTMSLIAVSEVKAVREVKPGIVAVLIAQPLSNWRNIPFDTKTFRGSWNLYKGIMEIVDVRRGVLLGRASFAGYPRAILSDDRLAVYRELEDGRPIIEIYQLSIAKTR